MKKSIISLLLVLALCMSLVPAAGAAEPEPIESARSVTEADLPPQEIAHINSENMGPDTFEVKGQTYYVGPTQWSGDDPQFASGMAPNWDTVDNLWIKIGIWTRGEGRDAPFVPVEKEALTALLQGAELHLSLYPLQVRGNYPAILEQQQEFPYQTSYCFNNQTGNQWVSAVTGTIQGKNILGTGFNEYEPQKSVQKLAETIEQANQIIAETEVEPGWRLIVQLPGGNLGEGTLVIPEGKGAEVCGSFDEKNPTTIHGGVQADGDVFLQDLHFVGKGKNVEKDNNGLFGSGASSGSYLCCSFEDFHVAIEADDMAMRFGGSNVTLKNNHIGYRMNVSDDADGLNPEMRNFVFEGNDIAVEFENLQDEVAGWRYRMINCSFLNNGMDVRNQSDRYLFLPNLYFSHDDQLNARIEGKLSVYPMAADRNFYDEQHQLLHGEKQAVVANQLAENYPIPADNLPGKTVTVIDSGRDGDEQLAAMTFPVAKPQVRLLAMTLAEPETFDATVTVERTEDEIRFTMADPLGKQPTVAIPCAWTDVTVTFGDTVVPSEADGETISFLAEAGGTYVISNEEEETPVEPSRPVTPVRPEKEPEAQTDGRFSDVAPDAWYYDAVQAVVEQGLMNGVGGGRFAPEDSASRAMILTMLARLEKVDLEGGSTWYEKAVAWAVAAGVSDGTNPEGVITRQQLVTMLWRYAGSPKAAGSLEQFRDADQVAPWAVEAMTWAVDRGLVSGMGDGCLNPNGTATRAQIAKIFCGYAALIG